MPVLSSVRNASLNAIKTVFPGLIISIIGGSFAFLVFNNPEKIRGKATLRAWESLKQYERLYNENTDRISCGDYIFRLDRIKTDMIHQIQMATENLKNIKDKESNVDNLMLAIINMKIDSYNEMKKLTEAHMDTMLTLFQTSDFSDSAAMARLDKWKDFYGKYMEECGYLRDRDTASINNILKDLKSTYSINFTTTNFLPDSAELFKKVIGAWTFSSFPISGDLKPDGTGYWRMLKDTFTCTWKLQSDTIKVLFNTKGVGDMNLAIKRIYPDILVFSEADGKTENIVVACRTKSY